VQSAKGQHAGSQVRKKERDDGAERGELREAGETSADAGAGVAGGAAEAEAGGTAAAEAEAEGKKHREELREERRSATKGKKQRVQKNPTSRKVQNKKAGETSADAGVGVARGAAEAEAGGTAAAEAEAEGKKQKVKKRQTSRKEQNKKAKETLAEAGAGVAGGSAEAEAGGAAATEAEAGVASTAAAASSADLARLEVGFAAERQGPVTAAVAGGEEARQGLTAERPEADIVKVVGEEADLEGMVVATVDGAGSSRGSSWVAEVATARQPGPDLDERLLTMGVDVTAA